MTYSVSNAKIAIIGGAGFIGHHLAIGLKDRGASPEVVDSLDVNHLKQFMATPPDVPRREFYLDMLRDRLELLGVRSIPLHEQDARDAGSMRSLLVHRMKPEVVIHLAGVSNVAAVRRSPKDTFDHSLRTLSNSLSCAAELQAHFVFFSSSMAYGDFRNGEASEDDQLEPLNLYGAMKVAGEKLVLGYNCEYGMPYTIVRPSALYGPRCVSGRVIQRFIESALRGDALCVAEKKEKLDFTYVDDLVLGVCAMIRRPAALNQTFNLTYGSARTTLEAALLIRNEFPGLAVRLEKGTPTGCKRGTLNIAKAVNLLGYCPEYPIERGIASYVSWYRTRNRELPLYEPVGTLVA